MSIETTEPLLNRFDYTYEKTNNQLEINLGLGLRVTADFSEEGRIKLKDELVTWNFLTGTLEMSLKRALVVNFIVPVFIIGLATFTYGKDYLLITIMSLLILFWSLLWSNYYITKAEQMKQTLRRWNEG